MLKSELIDIIYEAAVVPERWTTFLDGGSEYARAIGGTLFTFGHPTVFALRSESLAAPWDEFIKEGWSERNVRLQRVLAEDTTSFITWR